MKIGDSITFRAATRWGNSKATRKIVGIDRLERPLVRFGGWDSFVVMRHEIVSIEESE